jgi:hypothetical protein
MSASVNKDATVVQFLLLLMKHCDGGFKPDFHAVAAEAGIASANNA